MFWNQESVITLCIGLVLGFVLGRAMGFREMWRLRARADTHQYMAELFMALQAEEKDLRAIVQTVPGEKIFLSGRKNYVRWLRERLDDPRICDDPQAADTILTLTPGQTEWDKPTLWIGDLIRERKA